MKTKTIAILGAGAWGTALAQLLANNNHQVRLWFFDQDVLKNAKVSKINPFLSTCQLDERIELTGSLATALAGADLVLMTSPAQVAAKIFKQIKPFWPAKAILINCSKGIEASSGLLISELAAKYLPMADYAVLSGPSFAEELAQGKETAVVIASRNGKILKGLQEVFGSKFFRPYSSRDVVGVEVAGAYKNILVIVAGLLSGLKRGENVQAALIARGLKEMSDFGLALGAKRQTFFGLAGVGDLVLTAHSAQSRNYRFGLALAEGKAEQLLAPGQPVVEGYYTVKSVLKRAKSLGLDLNIASELNKVIVGKSCPTDSVHCLMCRNWKQEM